MCYPDAVPVNGLTCNRLDQILEKCRPTSPGAEGSGSSNVHNFFWGRDRALKPCCVCHNVMIAVRLVGF